MGKREYLAINTIIGGYGFLLVNFLWKYVKNIFYLLDGIVIMNYNEKYIIKAFNRQF